MQTLACYLYPILLECQVITAETVTTRYPIVYANRIKLYKFSNNQIKLLFKNNDQKSVNFVGYTVQFSIFKNRSSAAKSVAVTIPSGLTPVTSTVLTINSILDDLEPGLYNYRITTTNDTTGSDTLVYSDDNYSTIGEVEIDVSNQSEVTSTVLTPNLGTTNYTAGNSTLHTFQIKYTNFTGTVKFQASLDAQPGISNSWFDFATVAVTSDSNNQIYNFTGSYRWVRVTVVTTSGTVDNILYLS